MAKRIFTVTVKITDSKNETHQISADTMSQKGQGVEFYSANASVVAYVPDSSLILVAETSALSKDNS